MKKIVHINAHIERTSVYKIQYSNTFQTNAICLLAWIFCFFEYWILFSSEHSTQIRKFPCIRCNALSRVATDGNITSNARKFVDLCCAFTWVVVRFG